MLWQAGEEPKVEQDQEQDQDHEEQEADEEEEDEEEDEDEDEDKPKRRFLAQKVLLLPPRVSQLTNGTGPMNGRIFALIVGLIVAWQAAAQNPRPGHSFFKTPWITQNQYIEISILKDAGSMLVYAKNGQTSPVDVTCENGTVYSNTYRVTLAGKSMVATLDSPLPIWEPARYDSIVAQMGCAIGLEKPEQKPALPGRLLEQLQNPRIQTLAGLSLELSSQLKENMLDGGAHEQAALLLAAFTLRDRLEPYDDSRWALSRLTAHLALARWISGGAAGLEGRYALTTAYALMNLQTNALARLRELEKEPSANVRWNRALYARITGDSRPLLSVSASDLCLMEWAERIFANSRCNGEELVVNDFAKSTKFIDEKDCTSDLLFSLFQGRMPHSAGLGKAIYLEMALPLVMRDAETAWDALHEIPFEHENAEQLAAKLNVEAGLCVHEDGRIEILDWGAWAMESQRRCGAVYTRSLEFMTEILGLPGSDVNQAQHKLDKTLGKLWLVPCMQEERSTPEQALQAHQFLAARPHLVPPFSTRNLTQFFGSQGQGIVRAIDPKLDVTFAGATWAAGFPHGTLSNVEANAPTLYNSPRFKEALQRAPFNMPLVRAYVEQKKPVPAEARELLERLSNYSVFARKWLAQNLPENEPSAKEAIYSSSFSSASSSSISNNHPHLSPFTRGK